jgi:hypothetical protein
MMRQAVSRTGLARRCEELESSLNEALRIIRYYGRETGWTQRSLRFYAKHTDHLGLSEERRK